MTIATVHMENAASVLPYGYMSSTEVAALDYPALVYVFSSMAPGWGGPFISIAIIISILGSWLSFTILPAHGTCSFYRLDRDDAHGEQHEAQHAEGGHDAHAHLLAHGDGVAVVLRT